MKERPILFQGAMVRALLAGTKTQTRRVVKPVGNDDGFCLQDMGDGWWPYRSADGESCFYIDRAGHNMESQIPCPYGQPGDRLWVREAFCDDWRESRGIQYRADGGLDADMFDAGCRWRPSIHMPRAVSRILLEITGVRVERLQDISEADAVAEGIERGQDFPGWYRGPLPGDSVELQQLGRNFKIPTAFAKLAYRALWDSINGPGSWDSNPWVWVVEFKQVQP